MLLTDNEKKMLNGECGSGYQKAMMMLVAMAKTFNAEKMIPVSRTHVALSGQEGDTYWCELLVNGGAVCKVPPTTNPCWDVQTLIRPYHESVKARHLDIAYRTDDVYRRIGAKMSYCCTPEFAGNVPAFGEHVAFSESSATPYVNSILGAFSNRESSVSALASAVTGVTPLYGLHLQENRKANMIVKVEAELNDEYDWSMLGWYIGKFVDDNVPVVCIPKIQNMGIRPTPEMLLYFCTESSTSGAMPMFHIAGLTPEAPTIEAALSGNKVQKELVVTDKDLKDTQDEISDNGGKINMVLLGCPHYTYEQLLKVSELIGDRHVHKDVDFWILTSSTALELAKRNGCYLKLIRAGITPVPDTCMDEPCFDGFKGRLSMSDSAKCTHYQKRRGLPFVMRKLPECIEAAVKGEI